MSGISDGWKLFKDQAFGATPDYQGIAKTQASEQAANDQRAWEQNNGMIQDSPWGTTAPIYDRDGNITGRQTTLNQADQANLDASRGLTSQNMGLAGGILAGNAFGGAKPGISNFDTGLLGNMPGTSSGYQQRAEDAIYGQMTSRLDPQWDRRGAGLENQLRNQGLVPGSEAWTNAMQDFNMGRNDAYSSAMNNAIGMSGAEGSRMHGMDAQNFGLGLQGAQTQYGIQQGVHNSWLNDAMTQQQYDINKLGAGMTAAAAGNPGMPGQPGYAQMGATQAPNYLQAAALQGQGDQAQNSSAWDMFSLPFTMASSGAQIGKALK